MGTKPNTSPQERDTSRRFYRRLPLRLCRLITASVPAVIAILAAGVLTVASGFIARPEVFDGGAKTAAWIGASIAGLGAAATVIALHPAAPRRRWCEAAAWSAGSVAIFALVYTGLAIVIRIAGHLYHRGFD